MVKGRVRDERGRLKTVTWLFFPSVSLSIPIILAFLFLLWIIREVSGRERERRRM
jgi:hypothetical protein